MTTPPRRFRSALLLAALLAASAAAAPPEEEAGDPYEGFNRAMFAFNEKFDAWLLKPTAQIYDAVFPGPVKTGIANFFSNLRQPVVVLNSFLQGKGEEGFDGTGRFLLNSSFGVLGLFDLATDLGNPAREEDFGQTLAVWGVGPGPYFVWPIIGPRFARDTVGWGVDFLTYPLTYVGDEVAWGAYGVMLVDNRRLAFPSEQVLEAAAGDDKYLFVREAYRQRRQYLIHDGRPPRPDFFEDDPPDNNARPR